jgi:hypothetical protein
MLVVEVEVQVQRFSVVGFGGVIVRADHRGRGLAREIVQAALAKARTLGPAFALLFSHEDRAGLYRKLGFAEIISEVVVKQPDGCAPMPDRTMWQALYSHATWPDGAVIVHSLPFSRPRGHDAGRADWRRYISRSFGSQSAPVSGARWYLRRRRRRIDCPLGRAFARAVVDPL